MKNNFNNAIIQSPPISIPFRSDKEASNIFNIFSELLNCTIQDVKCLKEKPLDEILKAQNQVHSKLTSIKLLENLQPWLPWIDGRLIKGQLLEIEKWVDSRNQSTNTFMIGTLTEECFIYIFMGLKQPINTIEYCGIFLAGFKQYSLKVIEQFPPVAKEDNRNLLSQVSTRWIFSCSVRNFLEHMTKINLNKNESSYYHYVFDYPLDFEGNLLAFYFAIN
jgi:carboxylesterase type B